MRDWWTAVGAPPRLPRFKSSKSALRKRPGWLTIAGDRINLERMEKEALPVETLTMDSAVQQIGETAGAVWHALNENGSLSLAKLAERVGGNRDVVMQAVGWLAREGKIEIVETKRGRVVSLKD